MNKDATKLGQNLSKLAKIEKKLVKYWYHVNFDTKIYIINHKMSVI